jgi:hypothetical protein
MEVFSKVVAAKKKGDSTVRDLVPSMEILREGAKVVEGSRRGAFNSAEICF